MSSTKVVPLARQRIEKRLEAFRGLIDMSDWSTRPADQERVAFLSRALAAYCIQLLADTTIPEIAAKSVTDTYHDRGIDAVHYDPKSSRLFVVQSKWSDVIDWKDAGEFCDG